MAAGRRARPLPARHDRGFALYVALGVMLLFAFVATFIYMVIREGDRRVQRMRADRIALNLAETALGVLERRFTSGQGATQLPSADLSGGRGEGEMTSLGSSRYRIRVVGEAPIPGSEMSRTVLIVEGTGDPTAGTWARTLWRYARPDER